MFILLPVYPINPHITPPCIKPHMLVPSYRHAGLLSETFFIFGGWFETDFIIQVLHKRSNNFFSFNIIFDYTLCFFKICIRSFKNVFAWNF